MLCIYVVALPDIPIAEFATSLGKFRGRCSAAVRFRYILTDLDKS